MKIQKWMSQHYFIFFMAWGIFLPYWTAFLVHEKNISIESASLMMSVGLLLRGISTMFIFPLMAEKWSQKTVLTLYIIGSFATAVFYILTDNYAIIFILTCLLSFFLPAIMPGLDSAAGILVQNNGLNYGRARAYGSIGFIVSVALVSVITAVTNDGAMLWMVLFYLGLLLLLSFKKTPEILREKQQSTQSTSSFKAILKTKNFIKILLIVTIIQGSHAAYYNYGYLYLEQLAVPKYLIGIVINIGVVFEILLFAVADKWFGKWRPSKLLIVASAGAILRWGIVFLVPNPWVFAASQTLHALSFATAHYAFMLYLTSTMATNQIAKAQGIYSAFALSWSTAVLTVVSGFLYSVEPKLAFLAMAVCSIPAFFAAFLLEKSNKVI